MATDSDTTVGKLTVSLPFTVQRRLPFTVVHRLPFTVSFGMYIGIHIYMYTMDHLWYVHRYNNIYYKKNLPVSPSDLAPKPRDMNKNTTTNTNCRIIIAD